LLSPNVCLPFLRYFCPTIVRFVDCCGATRLWAVEDPVFDLVDRKLNIDHRILHPSKLYVLISINRVLIFSCASDWLVMDTRNGPSMLMEKKSLEIFLICGLDTSTPNAEVRRGVLAKDTYCHISHLGAKQSTYRGGPAWQNACIQNHSVLE